MFEDEKYSHKYLYFYSHDNYDYYCSQIHLS